MTRSLFPSALALALALVIDPNSAGAQTPSSEQQIYVLSEGSSLSLAFENASSALTAPLPVSGLNVDDELVAIDVRPQTGQLYGLGQNPKTGSVQLYLIDYRGLSARALAVGPAGQFVDQAGAPLPVFARGFDIDFNPTVDRLRVVSSSGLNFRMNPNNGALIDGDFGGAVGSVAGLNPDARLNGSATGAIGTAYTNNQLNASVTTQYALDDETNTLLIQQPPNAGVLQLPQTVTLGGSLLDFGAVGGLDIPTGINVASGGAAATGEALAALNSAGVTRLYRLNLATGVATLRGDFGAVSVVDIAVLSVPASAFALTGSGTQLVRFALAAPSASALATVTGLAPNERLVGIDLRPANGVLYGLGINAAEDRGTLYRLEPQSMGTTAAATAIGTPGQIQFVDAAGVTVDLSTISHGVDFNPVADRLRVVDASGLNFRVDPNNGAPVDGNGSALGVNPDGMISGVLTTQLAGTAYTNSVADTTITTQYTLDQFNAQLAIQNPPNGGTQTLSRPILLDGQPFSFGGGVGFDLPPGVSAPMSNQPVLAGSGFFTSSPSAGAPQLYRLDLTTANASALGAISSAGQELDGLVVTQAPAMLSLNTDSIFVVERSAPATITLRRTVGGAGLVRFATADGTAIAGQDYQATSGVLAFGSSTTSATFNLQVLVDTLDEPIETVLVNLTLPSGQTQQLTIFIIGDVIFADGFE
jgi:hypothetical protein